MSGVAHVMSVLLQSAPATLRDDDWDARRDELGDLALRTLETVAPRISALVVAVDGIAELDINPFFARPDGVVATDVRILIKEPGR